MGERHGTADQEYDSDDARKQDVQRRARHCESRSSGR